MKKIFVIIIALCIILSISACAEVAENVSSSGPEYDLSDRSTWPTTSNGTPYSPNEVIFGTNVYIDPSEYNEGEPKEFCGVLIIAMEPLFPESYELDHDFLPYCLTLDPSWEVMDAIEVLKESDIIITAECNAVAYLDTVSEH